MRLVHFLRFSLAVGTFAIGLSVRNAGATYVNITPDGDFSDWTSVPVAVTAPSNPSVSNDLESMSIANNNNYLFVLLTFYSPVNPNDTPGGGTYLALDNDNNPATGFNIFGLGLSGAEVGWQNDFPFAQSNNVFNTGGGITGGGGLISPFFTTTTTQEYAIARSATFTDTGLSIFPNNTFTLMAYSVDGPGKVLGPATYTFSSAPVAVVPEPGMVGLLAVGGAVIMAWRRSRRGAADPAT
jgi:hypothetical protein